MRAKSFGCGATSIALALGFALAARAEGVSLPLDSLDEGALRSELVRGLEAVKAGKSADAVAIFDGVDQKLTAAHTGGPRVFCGHGADEIALYMLKAASDGGGDAIAVDGLWCDAIYYEAYALSELSRFADAAKLLDRVLKMAPDDSLYLNERAELLTRERQYDPAIAMYQLAEQDSKYMVGDGNSRTVESVACRGIGYILVEQGKLDEADANYRRCLTLDPNDQKSEAELGYVAQLKAKKK